MIRSRKHSSGGCSKAAAEIVSYGTDNIINVWNVRIKIAENEEPHELEFRIVLQISMTDHPMELLLVSEVFIVSTKKHVAFHM